MKIINTATADLSKMSVLEQLALYSGMDNLALPEIHSRLYPELDETRRATYEFELELQAPLLEMSLNGIDVDTQRRAQLIPEYRANKEELTAKLHDLLVTVGYYNYYLTIARLRFAWATGASLSETPTSWESWLFTPLQLRKEWKKTSPKAVTDFQKALKELDKPFNPDSPAQKLRLFYHFFGHADNTISREQFPDFPPPWLKSTGISEYKTRSQNGEYTPSTDRDSLEKILNRGAASNTGAYWATPFITCCLNIADYSKSLQFLQCKLENGIFRSSFAAAAETGRLTSRQNAQGYGWNAQNVSPPLRIIFTCRPGWKMATPDYEQIESRNVGAICFTRFGATDYLDACESGDLHTLVCSMIWPDLPWPSDLSIDFVRKYGAFPAEVLTAAKKIANEKFYRHFSRRDLSKRGGHGSNYCGRPVHMAKMLHVETSLMEHYQAGYFEIFPEIPRWHTYVAEQIQSLGELTTLFGRKRQFFGRPSDDATIRKAVAFEPQSMAADYTNTALLTLHKAALYDGLPITLFLQKHDEIGFRYLETAEADVLPKVAKIMEREITLTAPDGTTRKWKVPTELQSGWNLGKYDYKNPDLNPDGTRIWQSPDSRTRTENPFSLKNLVL